ncbi:MAG: pseudaminic acid cytidylyltransferase [Prolixibacteraceae bacterium]|nr:pseudaminic acid cytidylyltransferase [Prolixibacteraceae bacterium]MBN2773195.1 pseudaminic acid cytidylyltransferase [Prolixibacteraceae bacterium]
MNNLAIIPARGGSKRIPRKNIRDFIGKPVISYPIETALKSRLFEEVMVSTDDTEIAEIATRFGAKVPFIRSAKNSDDFAPLFSVVIEVVEWYGLAGKVFDAVCCIFPTAALILVSRLEEAYSKMIEEKLDSVCPVVAFSHPVQRALEITSNNKLRMIFPENLITRSQDLLPVYHDSGAFVWVKSEALLHEKTLLCENGGAIVLPQTEVQDIDSESDWQLAEVKYRILNRLV